jgi:hypothetical protein
MTDRSSTRGAGARTVGDVRRAPTVIAIAMMFTLVVATAALAGCGSGDDEAATPATTTTTQPPATTAATATTATTLAPAESPGPAAGFCAAAAREFAAVTMEPGVPNPRCQYVTADERLRLTNAFDHPIDVTIGGVTATLQPGETQTVGPSFGSYLAPGVHVAHSAAYGGSGPELWLQ